MFDTVPGPMLLARTRSAPADGDGLLLKRRGDLEGAEAAWRRGDERGDGGAAFNLGLLLAKERDLPDARAAFGQFWALYVGDDEA